MSRLHLLSIEPLEARIAPANITATFAGGKLTIIGDDAANTVSIGAFSDGYTLYAGMGSHLIFNGTDLGDGGSKDIHAPITSLVVDLGAGDDSFDSIGLHFAKDVTIKGGAGKDTLKATYFHVGGDFNVDGGADDDKLQIEGDTQAGKLAVDLGGGTNQLQFNYTHLSVEGDSTIKAGTGVDTITTTQSATFNFGGKLDIALGGGDDSIGLGQDGLSAPDLFEVGGKFTITQGAHAGTFTVKLNPQTLRLGSDFTITTDGTSGGTNIVNLYAGFVAVAGKTTITSKGNAIDNLTLTSGVSLQLLSGVSVDLGEGKNTTLFGSTAVTLGALSYKGGAGDDKITFGGGVPVAVLGATDVKLGDGVN